MEEKNPFKDNIYIQIFFHNLPPFIPAPKGTGFSGGNHVIKPDGYNFSVSLRSTEYKKIQEIIKKI